MHSVNSCCRLNLYKKNLILNFPIFECLAKIRKMSKLFFLFQQWEKFKDDVVKERKKKEWENERVREHKFKLASSSSCCYFLITVNGLSQRCRIIYPDENLFLQDDILRWGRELQCCSARIWKARTFPLYVLQYWFILTLVQKCLESVLRDWWSSV